MRTKETMYKKLKKKKLSMELRRTTERKSLILSSQKTPILEKSSLETILDFSAMLEVANALSLFTSYWLLLLWETNLWFLYSFPIGLILTSRSNKIHNTQGFYLVLLCRILWFLSSDPTGWPVPSFLRLVKSIKPWQIKSWDLQSFSSTPTQLGVC